MSIVVLEKPYEIMFRLNSDGTIKGAHRKNLEVIADTANNRELSAKELDPIAVSIDDLDPVFEQINTASLSTITTHEREISQLQATIAELQARESDLLAQLGSIQSEVDEPRQE